MKRMICVLGLACASLGVAAQQSFPTSQKEDKEHIMSEAYWKIWNPKVQKQIDQDIEKYRKANGVIFLEEAAPGTTVQIKQVSHDFVFGASMFNFNQLGSPAANQRYRELFGTLFNRATVPFYWEKFEMQPGRPRFREEYWDTEAYWNRQEDPKHQPHWRRPAPDPMIAYCESHGVPVHGHPLTWGSRRWHHPNWIVDQILTNEERETLKQYVEEYADEKNFANDDKMTSAFHQATLAELEAKLPELGPKLQQLINKRMTEIVKYYGDRVSSWDVVNESAQDFAKGAMVPGSKLCKSNYGFMPGDFTYEAFQVAADLISENAQMNINDYWTGPEYAEQVKDLLKRGCRIDVVGSQMHLFDPQQCLDIAAGKEIQTPNQVWKVMNNLAETGLPIHLSEITITSPGTDMKGQQIQAVISQNLYRLWFSCKNMMGITWWNIVDDCGAPGEPSVSGLFHRDMSPKLSYYALDNLINHVWKTETSVKAGKNGEVKFRGFRGNLKLKPRLIGMNPMDFEAIKMKVLRSCYYISNSRLYGAIEMACLDIMGKAFNVPVHQLLGGKLRDSIPMIAYLFWRYDRPGGGHDKCAEDMADLCEELHETLGVQAMKLKAGVMDPMEEVRVLQLCREKLGDGFGLRIDPNGVWSVATAIKAGHRMEELEPQYFEDPSWGIEGMKAVHDQVRIPLATNMYPNKFDDLGPSIHMRSIDIVLTDLHYWEGPRGVKDLAAVCRTFNLGVAMHSGAEFGVELAAMLHTASTIPQMNMPGDAHYHYLEDDIIQGGKMQYVDGAIKVPDGPGLGVALDEEKMEKYERYYEEKGDYYARFHQDPYRPNWYPIVGGI